MSSKEVLLNELNKNTYVMLMASKVAGVGVFAIKHIPKGCRDMFTSPNQNDKWIALTRTEVDELPEHSRLLVENYCLYDEELYYVPENGFKAIDISLCLNHSDAPNVISINDGDYFEALRDIQPGEELFIDYGTIVEGE